MSAASSALSPGYADGTYRPSSSRVMYQLQELHVPANLFPGAFPVARLHWGLQSFRFLLFGSLGGRAPHPHPLPTAFWMRAAGASVVGFGMVPVKRFTGMWTPHPPPDADADAVTGSIVCFVTDKVPVRRLLD